MGGLVCNKANGHIIDVCMGKPADYILGLEAVLPDGRIIETGTKGLRRIAGTDLAKFFVGSDGIMGVVVVMFGTASASARGAAEKSARLLEIFSDEGPAPCSWWRMSRPGTKSSPPGR